MEGRIHVWLHQTKLHTSIIWTLIVLLPLLLLLLLLLLMLTPLLLLLLLSLLFPLLVLLQFPFPLPLLFYICQLANAFAFFAVKAEKFVWSKYIGIWIVRLILDSFLPIFNSYPAFTALPSVFFYPFISPVL